MTYAKSNSLKRSLIQQVGIALLALAPCLPAFGGCTEPPTEMVGWWTGDGGPTDVINGNDGVGVGSVAYTETGKVDAAFSILAPSGHIQVPNQTVLEPSAVTVDAWVRATNPGPYKYIAAKGADACNAASYGLYTGQNGGLSFYIWDGTTYYNSPNANSAIWNDNNWHHVAGTYDGQYVRLYLDGAEVGAGTAIQTTIAYGLATSNDFVIGDYLNNACLSPPNNYSFTDGDIDEVEVFSRALTPEEVREIYNAGSFGKCKTIPVTVDVKPGSDPNCFNINGSGVVPVAVLGSESFDVSQIDLTSLSFGGLAVRVRGNKGPLCSSDYSNDDVYPDLICHFEDDAGLWTAGTTEATLTGRLLNGAKMEGSDSICVVP